MDKVLDVLFDLGAALLWSATAAFGVPRRSFYQDTKEQGRMFRVAVKVALAYWTLWFVTVKLLAVDGFGARARMFMSMIGDLASPSKMSMPDGPLNAMAVVVLVALTSSLLLFLVQARALVRRVGDPVFAFAAVFAAMMFWTHVYVISFFFVVTSSRHPTIFEQWKGLAILTAFIGPAHAVFRILRLADPERSSWLALLQAGLVSLPLVLLSLASLALVMASAVL